MVRRRCRCGVGHVAEIVTDYVNRGGEALTLEPHLIVFQGLDALERDGRRRGTFCYPSAEAAFDAAAIAFGRQNHQLAIYVISTGEEISLEAPESVPLETPTTITLETPAAVAPVAP